jgi:hypothetical protein
MSVAGPYGRCTGQQKRTFSPGQAGREYGQACFPRRQAGFFFILFQQSLMPCIGRRAEQQACGGNVRRRNFSPRGDGKNCLILRSPDAKDGNAFFSMRGGRDNGLPGKGKAVPQQVESYAFRVRRSQQQGDVRYFPCQIGQGRPVLGPEAAAQSQFTGMHAAEGQRRTEDELRTCVQAGTVQFHDGSEVFGKVAGNGFRLDESCFQHATER